MRIKLNIDGVQIPFELGKDGKLTTVKKEKKFKKWYCGHYHKSEYYQGKYEVFYTDIARVL